MHILSWNIQWGRGADGVVDLARVIAAIRAHDVPDVICLQEVSQHFSGLKGGATGDQIAALQAAFPEHELCWGPVLDVAQTLLPHGGLSPTPRMRFGNVLLSRLPVLQVFNHLLPSPPDAQSKPGMPRGVIEAVLDTPSGPLRVLTTHLEYYSPLQRRAQIQALHQLQRWVEEGEGLTSTAATADANPAFAPRVRPSAAVLCGDFNFAPASEDYACMAGVAVSHTGAPSATQSIWWDAWVQLEHTAHVPTVGVHGAEWPAQPYCCDYFWVSSALKARLARVEVRHDTAASDHQPVCLYLHEV